ncbi:MAG: HPr kinase/phosphorylase [Pseudorhizobium sp.]
MGERINVHATAVVVGKAGLLFIGPSGIGKSTLALQCLATARRAGWNASLVADDQVFVTHRGGKLFASRPHSIAGLLEIRGSGIATVPSVAEAALDLAVLVVEPLTAERLPPAGETWHIGEIGSLPQIRLLNNHPEPLAVIAALCPDLGIPTTL